jgi:AcrR family transcriptional regulator
MATFLDSFLASNGEMAPPVSDCEIRDPRIRRTRRLLQRALQDLLVEKSLEDILVQDITDAATVNRATFYDHYTDKYALFEAMVAGDFHALLAEKKIAFDGTCPGQLRAIFLAVCGYLERPHLHACGGPSQGPFLPLMEAAITASIRRTLLGGMPQVSGANPNPPHPVLSADVLATTASWAIYSAVKEWYSSGRRLPAEQVAGPIAEAIHPILDAAFASGPSFANRE